MARDEREVKIFPTSLYTIRFVFNREPRATDEGRARGGRSDRRNLRSRRVRGPADPEDPQDPTLRALVRLRVAPTRFLSDHPLSRGIRPRARTCAPPLRPDRRPAAGDAIRLRLDRAPRPVDFRPHLRRAAGVDHRGPRVPRRRPRGALHPRLQHPRTDARPEVVLRLLRAAAPGYPTRPSGGSGRVYPGWEGLGPAHPLVPGGHELRRTRDDGHPWRRYDAGAAHREERPHVFVRRVRAAGAVGVVAVHEPGRSRLRGLREGVRARTDPRGPAGAEDRDRGRRARDEDSARPDPRPLAIEGGRKRHPRRVRIPDEGIGAPEDPRLNLRVLSGTRDRAR